MRPLLSLRVALVSSSVALVLSLAPPAFAHGGAFNEDGGGLPPLAAPPVVPGAPPVTTGTTLLNGRRARRARVSYSPLAWRHWWVLHRDELLPAAGTSTRRDPITGSVEAPRVGTLGVSELQAEADLAHAVMRRVVEPELARYAKRDNLRPVELAAALIAWARCASSPPDLRYFTERALAEAQCLEVRESALLALGLLRRSDPRARFQSAYVDRVRRFLEDVTADEQLATVLRVFACLSLGLLGDQPYEPKSPREATRTARVLWEHVRNRKADEALQHAAIIALGMQPTAGVPPEVTDALERIARGRNALRRRWHQTSRSQALATLARLGHARWRTIARVTLRSRRTPDILKYTAVALLGRAMPDMERWEREDVGKLLRNASLARSTPRRVRGELLISLGRVFAAAAADPDADLDELRKTRRALEKSLKDAALQLRPFAAIGLALGVREMKTEDLARHELAVGIRKHLAAVAPQARGSDEAVAAYALACGLAQADGSAPWMIEQLKDPNAMPVLRAHCALSLGLLGRAYRPIRSALREAAIDRRAPAIHLYAVRALTMLGQKHIPALLARNLEQTRSTKAQRTLVLGLARTARVDTLTPLLTLASDRTRSPGVRSIAIASLGLVADPEPRPSRTRLVSHVNRYLLSTEMLLYLNVL